MARKKEEVKKTTELKLLFLDLNKTDQEGVLAILKALKFAQSSICRNLAIADYSDEIL